MFYSCYDPIWNNITSDKVGSNALFGAFFFSIGLGVDDFINLGDLLGDMLLEEQFWWFPLWNDKPVFSSKLVKHSEPWYKKFPWLKTSYKNIACISVLNLLLAFDNLWYRVRRDLKNRYLLKGVILILGVMTKLIKYFSHISLKLWVHDSPHSI